MSETIKKNIFFILAYAILFTALLIILSVNSKAEIHIFLNSFHNPFLNLFFKSITHLGSGYFAFIVFFILLFIKYKWALIFAVSNILTGLVVQVLKRLVFDDYFRPGFFFQYLSETPFELYIIPGTDPAGLYSFPSGHTATAFAIFFLLSLISNKNYLKISFFLAAVLISYSRIYLSWHFLEDTVLGSFIGIVITFFSYILFYKSKSKFLNSKLNIRKNSIKQ